MEKEPLRRPVEVIVKTWSVGIAQESKRTKETEKVLPILGHMQAGIHLMHRHRSMSKHASPSCNYVQQRETRGCFECDTNHLRGIPVSFH